MGSQGVYLLLGCLVCSAVGSKVLAPLFTLLLTQWCLGLVFRLMTPFVINLSFGSPSPFRVNSGMAQFTILYVKIKTMAHRV